MKHAPNSWDVLQLFMYVKYQRVTHRGADGERYPVRCMGMYSLANRIKLAWEVFTGRSDVLRWPDQE